MPGAEAFARGFVHNLEQQQGEIMDKVIVVMTLVGVARALLSHWGKQAMEAVIRHLAGQKGVDPEGVFAQVDSQTPKQL